MRSLSLAGALVVTLAVATPADAGSGWAERLSTPRAAGRGIVKGFRHTIHAIRPLPKGATDAQGQPLSRRARWTKPARYTLMVGGIFAVGAASRAVHVDPEPFMLGLSGLAYAYQLKTRALPVLRGTRGDERVEAFAAEVIYPGLLVAGSGLGGMALGHGGETSVLQSGAQSAVIGFDVPTILQGAADHGDMGPSHEAP